MALLHHQSMEIFFTSDGLCVRMLFIKRNYTMRVHKYALMVQSEHETKMFSSYQYPKVI